MYMMLQQLGNMNLASCTLVLISQTMMFASL
jgi:hypothetical protein